MLRFLDSQENVAPFFVSTGPPSPVLLCFLMVAVWQEASLESSDVSSREGKRKPIENGIIYLFFPALTTKTSSVLTSEWVKSAFKSLTAR